MSYHRHINRFLNVWKSRQNRKPLILRGARQVGKTTLIKEFGKSYPHFIALNLEKAGDRAFFERYSSTAELVESLLLYFNLQPDYAHTLLFIDEIQESQEALNMLRYFHEDFPDLHVIAAGSFLEFALGEATRLPVGRVSFAYLFPLNFEEFLQACGETAALRELKQTPMRQAAYHRLMELFNTYAIIGGMPEVISTWIEQRSIAALPAVYEGIWDTYKRDIEKYARNDSERRIIRHILNSAPNYLDERITFQNFGNSNYRSREVGEAFRALDDARVLQLIYPATETSFPLKPDLKKKPRMQFLDTGIVSHALRIQHELIGINDLSTAFKGSLIPHLIFQEIISLNEESYQKPAFWVREKAQSSAEVDMLLAHKGLLIPVEIKSGAIGKLRSLHQYMEHCPHTYAVRLFAGHLEVNEIRTPTGKSFKLLNLPYCLGSQLPSYLQWFTDNY